MKNPLLIGTFIGFDEESGGVLRGTSWENRTGLRMTWRGAEVSEYRDRDSGFRVYRTREKS